MKFVFPNLEYEEKAKEFINEFYEYQSEINGVGGLDNYLKNSTYTEWIAKVLQGIDIANIEEGHVPAFTYFYVDDTDGQNDIIGMINIRLSLNDFLLNEGGHIGYSIRPTKRKQGYATMMLKQALEFCSKIGLTKVLITCDKDNVASAGVIINCGGILENECYSETFHSEIQRYWIEKDSAK